ncbi:sodium:proton antiporter [Shewanella sp. D64]|uniref:Na+/H+ antiporter NhaC family protein n=1 Tax=unclassified Shewanella TaxID=196818 RepID=UPI0022BA2C1F|nr:MULTISPECIES: Na+/H+ antiporter NhaC family protein [unclassified Shewanella]MEC4727072.1 sodium:proton antiporter [Shewanella sp. D64]MEC4737811.1 sodium:proton antiporter [Shewanella sp. E94]WBJ93932.1 sodium:proton antiporter [Shewanella sp. MTB7]
MMRKNQTTALFMLIFGLLAGIFCHHYIDKQWLERAVSYELYSNLDDQLAYKFKGKEILVGELTPYQLSPLSQENLDKLEAEPSIEQQWVQDSQGSIRLLKPAFHFGIWSLLPAFITVCLCLLTREPLVSLLTGIIVGAFMLGQFDVVDKVLIPNLASEGTASLLLLYLWLLGGLLGIWTKTGAAQAFADYMAKHFVKGPKSAKLVTWFLGVLFFQGGTMSTVLVGTTVRPLADKAKVSHEEMSYIVDSTASPIAAVLAFNAWPAYVQALIFVPGVTFLATESDRLSFFFSSIPFSFYGIFAVIGTLLLSLNITKFSGKRIQQAHQRAATTGELDAPGARPLSAKELQAVAVPANYRPNMLEFVVPLVCLIGIAIGTFVALGSPKVNWAFTAALLLSSGIALFKGMSLNDLIDGFGTGLKGVVLASVILMLAVIIGSISKQIGGGLYLVSLLAEQLPYWLVPLTLQLITMLIAFSTGTSWGTYAIAFPLAMPLAWEISQVQGLANPELYLMVCFATVLNGSIYGDQCSPISDTTVLSAMTTGCDLMDHVKSQIVPASLAAAMAAILWTALVYFFV